MISQEKIYKLKKEATRWALIKELESELLSVKSSSEKIIRDGALENQELFSSIALAWENALQLWEEIKLNEGE